MDIVLFSMIAMRMTGLIFMNPIFGRRNTKQCKGRHGSGLYLSGLFHYGGAGAFL